jgi:hypothetical protein
VAAVMVLLVVLLRPLVDLVGLFVFVLMVIVLVPVLVLVVVPVVIAVLVPVVIVLFVPVVSVGIGVLVRAGVPAVLAARARSRPWIPMNLRRFPSLAGASSAPRPAAATMNRSARRRIVPRTNPSAVRAA